MYGRISRAPSAQLMPTLNGCACATEVQNASTVWPESVRPLRSVIVTEIHQRQRAARTSTRGDERGFGVERVEDRLDQQEVDAAVDQRRGSAPRRPSCTWSNVSARNDGSLTSGEIESVRLAGRWSRRRTGRRPRRPRARASWAPRRSSRRRAPRAVVGLGDRRGGERVGLDDVGAGREVVAVNPENTSGRVSFSRSGYPRGHAG